MNQTYDFTDRVALVTGGASGIGRECALSFAKNGADVVVADVQTEEGREVVEEIEASGGQATFAETDVADANDVETMVETAVDEYGRLDFGVNNAGIRGERHQINEYPREAWQDLIDINLTGVFSSVKHEVDQMLEQEDGGAIVNVSSVIGKSGLLQAVSYAAAKHGVIGITRTAAMEVSDLGVRVNAVCPGYIETPMLGRGDGRVPTDEETAEEVRGLHPIGRLGEPNEIAEAVIWLCSGSASFVTGEAVNVDGGYMAGK